jgi:hypothetical protein
MRRGAGAVPQAPTGYGQAPRAGALSFSVLFCSVRTGRCRSCVPFANLTFVKCHCPVSDFSMIVFFLSDFAAVDETQHFLSHMYEDGIGDKDKEAATATADKLSYVAFLCYVHRKIQDRFS